MGGPVHGVILGRLGSRDRCYLALGYILHIGNFAPRARRPPRLFR